jgi:RNA polymerase sigma-70 factor (ECF subfamily)
VLSDEALMMAYQRGETAAFAELVTRHERPLWSFLRRLTRDEVMAEDLLQETFMRVIHSAHSWRPEAKLTTWIYTIARNLYIDHARKQAHRRALSLDGQGPRQDQEDSSPRLHERVAGSDPDAERVAYNRELAVRLEHALAALPEAQREVFLMREVLELPFAEIAQVVGASEATIKSRMRYALERLRVALADSRSERPAPEAKP